MNLLCWVANKRPWYHRQRQKGIYRLVWVCSTGKGSQYLPATLYRKFYYFWTENLCFLWGFTGHQHSIGHIAQRIHRKCRRRIRVTCVWYECILLVPSSYHLWHTSMSVTTLQCCHRMWQKCQDYSGPILTKGTTWGIEYNKQLHKQEQLFRTVSTKYETELVMNKYTHAVSILCIWPMIINLW